MRKSIGLLAVAAAMLVGCGKDKVEVIDGVKIQFHAHDDKAQKLKDGDIITFDLSEQNEVTADIYISIDRVRENAKALGVSIKNELHRVVFHGALHLCGYKDKKPAEIKIMRAKEEGLLSRYGV